MSAFIDQYSKEELEKIVKNSNSFREVSNKLGYSSHSGASSKIIKNRLDKYNIDWSHFSRKETKKRTVENVFIKEKCDQSTLRRFYLEGNYTEYECSICGQKPFWNDKELKMILDHIDGNREDNTLKNLRWVCPNCNIQLDTFGSKNRKNLEKKELKNYCIDCGIEIYKDSTRCYKCFNKSRRIVEKRPEREELKKLIRQNPFTKIAKEFGVSDNGIRKWCKSYNLPFKKTEINNYTDQEWELI